MMLAPPAESAACDLAHGEGRLADASPQRRLSVGHKVFSHLMKPVAPRQLLNEVRAAIDRED
jgi:hypothetical protein